MAHISSDQHGLLAVSVGNLLQIFNSNSNSLILNHINELSKEADSNDSNFIQHVFSNNQKYFAAITGDKKLLVWDMMENCIALTCLLTKRPTCLCFCNKENTLIVGDKSGDVYRYTLCEENNKPQPILGHLSMVLDVALSFDDSFIVSADRDEKIRVSFYPNAYCIHSYCLGHDQLVSTIALVSNDFLISGSADKTLRMWDFKDGSETCSFDITDKVDESTIVLSKVTYYKNDVAVMAEGSNTILFFCCDGNSFTYRCSYRLSQLPYDICYQGGKLFILVHDAINQIIILEKENDVYIEKYISVVNMLQDCRFSTASLPDSKRFTDLVKPQTKKRTSIEITPESSINYIIAPKTMRIEA